jgi:hypothetical protein
MGVLKVARLELSQPLQPPETYDGYEGVRFFCFHYGELLGYFTVWHYGRDITLFEVKDKLRDVIKNRPDILELPHLK